MCLRVVFSYLPPIIFVFIIVILYSQGNLILLRFLLLSMYSDLARELPLRRVLWASENNILQTQLFIFFSKTCSPLVCYLKEWNYSFSCPSRNSRVFLNAFISFTPSFPHCTDCKSTVCSCAFISISTDIQIIIYHLPH